jgi:hypothetical protein
LTVGHGDLVQTYQEDCVHHSEDNAKEAVCRRALALNVEGFLEWLRASMVGGGGVSSTGQTQGAAPAHSADEASMVSVESNQDEIMPEGKAKSNGMKVDWQAQLARESARHSVVLPSHQSDADIKADFCAVSGLQQPRFSQKVERMDGMVVFLGTVVLEEEQYTSS